MPNDFTKQDNPTLIHVAQTLSSVAHDDPDYGIAPAAALAIGALGTNLQGLALQWAQQEAVLRGLTEQRAAARAALVSKLGMTAKALEASPQVSDAMLRAAALSARPSKGTRPASLDAPTGLTVEGFSDGTLVARWTPQARTRVSYLVEVSAEGQSWNYLATTQRRTLRASGFAPGVAVYARVFAVNSTLSSPPSNVASVYAPAVPAEARLRVA